MPNITDRDSAFDWVEQLNPFARDPRHDADTDGYLRYLQEKPRPAATALPICASNWITTAVIAVFGGLRPLWR